MNEADKVTSELMALADDVVHHCGFHDGERACHDARAALEQAIRRAVDWGEPVARVVNAPHMHTVGPDDGGYYAIQPITNDRLEDTTPLYARNKP